MNDAVTRPLLVFDGDFHFCKSWVARWQQATGDAVDCEPFQTAAPRFPEIPREAFETAVKLIEPDGIVTSGAEAVFRSLACRDRKIGRWLYENAPGFAPIAEGAYGVVAQHRAAFSKVTRLIWGETVARPSHRLVSAMFLRLLGVVYLIAILSLWLQIDGLIGSRGILPVESYMTRAHEVLGSWGFWRIPTLAWWWPGDAALHCMCGAGVVLSLLLIAGIAPALSVALLWAVYLSLTVAGQIFLSFQWDILLQETGFLAIFFAPMSWRFRFWHGSEPSGTMLFLLRLLLFKLMVMSGLTKLTSGDPAWLDGSALTYHFETQPLPTVLGWYAHHMPPSFQSFQVWAMFFIEIAVPCLIFVPRRRVRVFAFAWLVALQLAIAATGNYGFFNLLTIVLCVLVLDDGALPCWLARFGQKAKRIATAPGWLTGAVATMVLLLTPFLLWSAVRPASTFPAWVAAPYRVIAPFGLVNSYGLFRVMTRTRPEIIVEGSNDGEIWKPYVFKWKPGALDEPPHWVQPHMPRLDWQMWFAALGDPRGNPWFLNFLERLAERSPPVLALLRTDPFPDAAPRYFRAKLYQYHFTTREERDRTGDWWRRDELGDYLPTLRTR